MNPLLVVIIAVLAAMQAWAILEIRGVLLIVCIGLPCWYLINLNRRKKKIGGPPPAAFSEAHQDPRPRRAAPPHRTDAACLFMLYGFVIGQSQAIPKPQVAWVSNHLSVHRIFGQARRSLLVALRKGRIMSAADVAQRMRDGLSREDVQGALAMAVQMACTLGEPDAAVRHRLATVAAALQEQPHLRFLLPAADQSKLRDADACRSLGVARDCSDEELRMVYRRLIRSHHPDRVPQDDEQGLREANQKTAMLTAAYRTASALSLPGAASPG